MEPILPGQKRIEFLLKNKDHKILNEMEKKFIRDLHGKLYDNLSKHQQAVVVRLIGWIKGAE